MNGNIEEQMDNFFAAVVPEPAAVEQQLLGLIDQIEALEAQVEEQAEAQAEAEAEAEAEANFEDAMNAAREQGQRLFLYDGTYYLITPPQSPRERRN